MSNSPNLQLPYLDANQNQKTVTHNAALTALDALVNCQVQSAALTAPPSSPGDGQCWIVGSGSTGAWTGKDLNIAAWQDGAWSFYPPTRGMLAYNDATATLVVWNGTGWANLNSLLALMTVMALGIGTAPDTGNPLSATLNAALFNALVTGSGGTGDVRLKLNKQAVANTASFLFQDGFSGRAEIGLCGDDSFHFKVSADGSTWTDAIKVAADGSVSIAGAVNHSSGATGFAVAQRAAITTQAVPILRPTSANTSIALDIMPNGTAVPAFGDMIAWIDVCDADVATSTSTPLNKLMLAARTSVMEIGSNSLYGGTGKPLAITYQGVEKARVTASGWGFGTTLPNYPLTVSFNAATAALPTFPGSGNVALQVAGADATAVRVVLNGFAQAGFLDFCRADGTNAAPLALGSGATLGQVEWSGYNGTAYALTKAAILGVTSEAWSASANGTRLDFYTVPVTTTAPRRGMSLLDSGIAEFMFGTQLDGSSGGSTRLQAAPAASGTLTLPAATDTLVGRTTTDTLTNKTLTAPIVTGSLNGGPLGGFRNRLINGNFAVNQRAFASGGALAAGVYGFDRWKAGAGGATLTFTAAAPDTMITITAGTLIQVIEAANIEGGAYTLSWTGTATARVYQGTASGAYAASPLVVTGLAAGAATSVEFSTGTLGAVQAEPGSAATLFERRHAGVDLALAERYYRVLNVAGMQGVATYTTTALFNALFNDMRASPSITLLKTSFSASIYDIIAGGSTWVNASGMTLSAPQSTTVTFSTTVTGWSGLTTGWSLFGNNPYPFIGLSAEL